MEKAHLQCVDALQFFKDQQFMLTVNFQTTIAILF